MYTIAVSEGVTEQCECDTWDSTLLEVLYRRVGLDGTRN